MGFQDCEIVTEGHARFSPTARCTLLAWSGRGPVDTDKDPMTRVCRAKLQSTRQYSSHTAFGLAQEASQQTTTTAIVRVAPTLTVHSMHS